MSKHTVFDCHVPFCRECLDRIIGIKKVADELLDKGNDLAAPDHEPSKNVLIRNLIDLYDEYLNKLSTKYSMPSNQATLDGFISYLRGQL